MIITDTGGDFMIARKFVLRETGIIAIGECVGVAAMWGIFALLGFFDRSVLLGGIVGAVLSTLNFFFMAMAADMAADKAVNQDVKGGKNLMRSSQSARMIVIFIVLYAFFKSGLCNALAMVIPFVMVRPTITVAEFFRKAGEK